MISESHNTDNLLFMKNFPDKFFDLALCDVNYGIGEARRAASRNRPVLQRNGKRTQMPAIHVAKDWDDAPPTQEYFDEVFRVAKKHVIFGCNYLQFEQKGQSSGRIFWDKVNGGSDFSDGELIWTNLFTGIRKITYMWNGFCQGISLSEPTRQRGNKRLNEKRLQPGQKPTALYYALLEYAKPGSKILDTHLGSQTSRCVAHDLGFDFWGCELDLDNFLQGEKRFDAHIKKSTLF